MECTLWNEVWASSELTEEIAWGDFYSMPPKQIMQGPVTEQISVFQWVQGLGIVLL